MRKLLLTIAVSLLVCPVLVQAQPKKGSGFVPKNLQVSFSPVGGYSTAQMWTDGQGVFKASKCGSVAYKIHSSTGDGKYRSEEMIIQASELEKPIAITLHPIQA